MRFFANVAKSLYIGETGFNEDKTNCGIAHILGIPVMSSCGLCAIIFRKINYLHSVPIECLDKEANIMASYGFHGLRARQFLSIVLFVETWFSVLSVTLTGTSQGLRGFPHTLE